MEFERVKSPLWNSIVFAVIGMLPFRREGVPFVGLLSEENRGDSSNDEDSIQKARADRMLRVYMITFLMVLIVLIVAGFYFLV